MAGHRFQFDETVPLLPGAVESAALGVDATPANKFSSADVNKVVKLAANNNYILVADGNDIEGVVVAISPYTVNDGWSHGSVLVRSNGIRAVNGGIAAIAVGAEVIAGPQAALGTAQEYPVVKAGAGVLFKWRVKSLLGAAGAIGATILIEPITR